MVATDFLVVCIGQKIVSKINIDGVKLEAYKNNVRSRLFEWDVFQSLTGIMYDIMPVERITQNYDVEFFCVDLDNRTRDGYVTPLTDFEKHIKIIEYYIEKSPIKSVAILFRYQSRELGKISVINGKYNFYSKLKQNKIQFNKVYIVKDGSKENYKNYI